MDYDPKPREHLVAGDTNGAHDVFVHDRLGCSSTVASYCTPGTTSHGCEPVISGLGVPSATAGFGFTIAVNLVEGSKNGLVFYGLSGSASFPWSGGSSLLCVKPPTQRTSVQ